MASQWGRQGKPVAGFAPNFSIDEQPQTSCGCLRQKTQCGSYVTNGKPKPSPKPHPYTELHLFLKFSLLFPLLHLLFTAFLANIIFQVEAIHLLYSSEVSGSVSCIPEKQLEWEQPRLYLPRQEVSAVPLLRCNKKEHGRKCYPSVSVFSIVHFPPPFLLGPIQALPLYLLYLS